MAKIRRKRKRMVDKLYQEMGPFRLVIPALQGVMIYSVDAGSIEKIDGSNVSPSVKAWFRDNKGESFDEDSFFSFLEEDTSEIISSDDRKTITDALTIQNESILVSRLSPLQMMQAKNYPSDLSSYVQAMYKRGSQTEVTEEDSAEALFFHQWVVCKTVLDPKVMSLKQVTNLMNGKEIDHHWFRDKDLKKLHEIREQRKEDHPGMKYETIDVQKMSELVDAAWKSYDENGKEIDVDLWWVESFSSDVDLVTISGAAINGPSPEERPDVRPSTR
jgi:hypothetical protein